MLQDLFLIDALSSASWEKKQKKKRKKKQLGAFFRARGQTHLCGCAMQDLRGC
jgi:hypothetical protein